MALGPYSLPDLPPHSLHADLAGLSALVGRANAMLSRYDGLLESLVNPGVLLSPLLMKEAELSSRIEGTIATANEVYEQQAGAEFLPEKQADIEEILNYRQTLALAARMTAERAISAHLIRSMHADLMKGVRGQNKNPGKFRATQNWIGPKGCTMKEATYVPPRPVKLQDHMQNLTAFMQTVDAAIDPIVQTGLLHAQFELIHPFDDGNGRIGRLLIPLYLTQRKCLISPSFYVSAYFEYHRDEYISRLSEISSRSDWKSWIVFFLEAVVHQAQSNLELVRKINVLYEEMKIRVSEATHSEQTIAVLDTLFDRPIFSASDLHERLGIQRQRASKYVRALKKAGILTELRPASGRRAAVLSFDQLLDITGAA